MQDYIFQVIIWVFAIYGFIELTLKVINTTMFLDLYSKGMYIIIGVKNQEDNIETFLRTIIFKIIYGKQDETLDKIIVADLGSTDDTPQILKRLEQEYEMLKVTEWRDCKNILDNIVENK